METPKLFCIVVTDPDDFVGIEGPIIFHVSCDTLMEAEEEVTERLKEGYQYDDESIERLDIFGFEVEGDEIIKLK
jgi:hypothetical protein